MNKFFIALVFLIAVCMAATTTKVNPPNPKLWKTLDLKKLTAHVKK
jgi:hypothetical protein